MKRIHTSHSMCEGKISSALLVVLMLGGAAAIAAFLIFLEPEPQTHEPEKPEPVLEVVVVSPEKMQLTVSTQGTVQARTDTRLASEVSGRVIGVADDFHSGGFFDANEVLLQIDPADYEAALTSAQAALSRAELALAREIANAEQAEEEWESIGKGEPTDLALRKPQLASARAEVSSAQAAVRRAERDLEATNVSVPYEGRIESTMVDVGDYIAGPGTPLAMVYAVDRAEVRLSLTDRQYALLDMPYQFRDEETPLPGNEVYLRASIGEEEHVWMGYIERSEGIVDRTSRLLYVVAVVEDPYGSKGNREAPLKIGMFVDAEIMGRELEEAYVVPRSALANKDTVLVVDEDDKLHQQKVKVVQAEVESAIITEGLEPGMRVVVSPVEYVVEGMSVIPKTRKQLDTEMPQVESEGDE